MLFLNNPDVPIEPIGARQPPEPARGFHRAAFTNLTERRWITVEGRVTFVSKRGAGLEFELQSDRDLISVWLADAAELDSSRLLNARVQVTGAGRGVVTADQRIVLGRLFAANAQELVVEETIEGQPPFPITSVAQVQSLPIAAARRGLPVRIRGVVTSAKHNLNEHWMSIQDETRGIFVSLYSVTNSFPASGEFWEVEGHSGAGDFAPVIIADKTSLLGDGRLPEPVRPTWIELLNGSLDVQWAEIQGLVTGVHSNNLSLWLPEGLLEVQMDGRNETQLKPFEKSVVRVRGVLYATWDAQTREVRVGRVMMRNADINVDTPAPLNPFEAVEKTPRELFLFDPHATPYRQVKVHGQILHADATQIFLEEAGTGLRLLPAGQTDLHPGDLVEAVGYPDFSRTAVQLREVMVRKTGQGALPVAHTS